MNFPKPVILPCVFVVAHSTIHMCRDGDTVEKQAGHRIIELICDDRQIGHIDKTHVQAGRIDGQDIRPGRTHEQAGQLAR